MAYDAGHVQVVLFSGQDNNFKYLNDTWVWDGTNWLQKSPATSPSLSGPDYAMTYDPAHNQTLLVNRNVAATPIVWETWLWDGANWTKKIADDPSFKGGSPVMAFDSARNQVVMILAAECIITIAQTWVWDGTNWTQQSPQRNPTPLERSAFAYDASHSQSVLFGGNDSCPGPDPTNQTWLWDGTIWTPSNGSAKPPVRTGHAMAYEAGQSRVVLFGGNSGNNFLGDTWTWDGANWTQAMPSNSPPARYGHSMAYDSGHGEIILFGGNGSDENLLADTWTWSSAGTQPVISNVISASGFGGFTSVAPGSWVEIYGSNLSSTTRGWAGSDFNGNNAPTSLDGVAVQIGGEKAFIDYISASPGQVNAQLPSNIAAGGMLQLTVTNGSATSAPFNINVNSAEPGLLAPASFNIGGKQYLVAQLADGNYVLPAGVISGVNSRPAKPGETIVVYGIGFGTVSPNINAGEIATVKNQLTVPLDISFAQTPAQLEYSGLAPSFVGLYQFNIVVPVVGPGNLEPLSFSLNGTPGAQALFTAVAAP